MKKIAMMTVFLAGCFFVANGYVQAKSVKRVEPRHVFSGRVVQVDVAAGAFTLKDRGNTVGFDASNPIFSGYRSLSAMHPGDWVAVSYTTDGIRVAKLTGRPASVEGAEVGAGKRPAGEAPKGNRTRTKEGLIKRQKSTDDTGFDQADAKKDGKITPVELSVVIKDVTLDEFRQFDKNHHGYLNKAEFLEAVKHLKVGGR